MRCRRTTPKSCRSPIIIPTICWISWLDPDFDAAVLQSHYDSIPIRLLNLLKQKTKALVVDGHTVSGVDIDRVGTDWEDALELAVQHLCDLGHRSFGLLSINTMAQPVLAARRAFTRHAAIKRGGICIHAADSAGTGQAPGP